MGLGIGLIQKALYIATFGLSGRVFKDDSRKPRAVKAAARPARSAKPAEAAQTRAQKAPRRATKKARTSTAAKGGASGKGTATELKRLAKLHAQGALTDEEFAAAKAKILGTTAPPPAKPDFPSVEANVAAARQLADLAGQEPAPSVATTGNSTLGNG
jgi:multidrug resistance efflux pump